jgi:tripartite-type tricarboxylate transporter receptor subunit TctC
MNPATRGIRWRTAAAAMAVSLIAVACGSSETVAPAPAPAPSPAPAPAPAPAGPFLQGKTIQWIVPFSPGGTGDLIARVSSSILSDFVEGSPSIVVRSMPGGGGLAGANTFWTNPSDGTSLLIASLSQVLPWLLGEKEVQYDMAKMTPLFGVPATWILYTRPETGVTSIKDFANPKTELIIGLQSPTGVDLPLLLAFEILGIADSLKMVFGYGGAGATAVAYEQGEINVGVRTTNGLLLQQKELLDAGVIQPIFTLGISDGKTLSRDPLLPDVPTVGEVYKELYGSEPSGELWDLLVQVQLLAANFGIAVWTHSDADPAVIDALIDGFEQTVNDPVFMSVIGDRALGGYAPVIGDAARQKADATTGFSEELIAALRTWLTENYDVDLG